MNNYNENVEDKEKIKISSSNNANDQQQMKFIEKTPAYPNVNFTIIFIYTFLEIPLFDHNIKKA